MIKPQPGAGRAIKSWLFDLPPIDLSGDPPAPGETIFDKTFRLWDRVEALGFEGIMLSEHHWPISLSASPNLMLAVLAVRTRRLRIGQLAITAPLAHPGRIAEELATLDQLSGGRLEIGLARGGSTREVELFGLPPEEMQGRLDEALEIVEGALTAHGPFTYEGRFYRCDQLDVHPKTLQKPLPRIWLPVVSSESCAKAARRGYRVCAGFRSTDFMAQMFDAYRAAADEAGLSWSHEDLAIRRAVVIDPDEQAARRLGRSLAEQFASFEALSSLVTDDDVIAGTADQVFEQIAEQCERTGAGHILLYGSCHMPADEYARIIEIYGAEVLPRLLDTTPAASKAATAE